jgi:uncharacterized protein DUF4386
VSHDEQLAWEARVGKPAAVAAFAAAFMAIASGIYLQAAARGADDADDYLREVDQHATEFIVGGVLVAVASLLMLPVLAYLYRAIRYRRGELMPAALYLAILGTVAIAVIAVWRYVEVTSVAHDFFPFTGTDAKDAAEDELRDALPSVIQGVGLAGSIALAFAMVMISLNAMRAGLLSRFMSILGIFVGILLVIPLGVQILQLFWFAALGVLFLDRWPGGRGPAWQTGEAIPWPGAAEQREEIERRRAEREGLLDPPGEDEAEPEAQRPASRKRRKKKR